MTAVGKVWLVVAVIVALLLLFFAAFSLDRIADALEALK